MTGRRSTLVVVMACVLGLAAVCWMALRPRPRLPVPLALDDLGLDGPSVVRDGRGRPIITNFRTVEPGVLFRGSAFPTSFPAAGGGREYADRTAFDHLRALNVRHVIAMLDDADTYYAEDGYLRYWSEQTGFPIATTWIEIEPTQAFEPNDRGGLRAAGVLIALMREGIGGGGAVYLHDIDGIGHAGVAAAGYELWRNRGWNTFDTTWTLVERRFLAANETGAEAARAGRAPAMDTCANGSRAYACADRLRELRRRLAFLIEL